jgi:hypothetical protein
MNCGKEQAGVTGSLFHPHAGRFVPISRHAGEHCRVLIIAGMKCDFVRER